jgi:hypothetical protein
VIATAAYPRPNMVLFVVFTILERQQREWRLGVKCLHGSKKVELVMKVRKMDG